MTTDKKIVTAICQECGKQFEYELNPKFPRKYCFECSAAKKASFEATQYSEEPKVPVVKPGEPAKIEQKAPEKVFHLSPEQVNTNALNCAISVHVNAKIVYTPEQIIEMAKIFKEFIENGN